VGDFEVRDAEWDTPTGLREAFCFGFWDADFRLRPNVGGCGAGPKGPFDFFAAAFHVAEFAVGRDESFHAESRGGLSRGRRDGDDRTRNEHHQRNTNLGPHGYLPYRSTNTANKSLTIEPVYIFRDSEWARKLRRFNACIRHIDRISSCLDLNLTGSPEIARFEELAAAGADAALSGPLA
jgi:hypothetical protein